MAGKDLERTRVDLQRPKLLVGDRADLDIMIREGTVRAVGHYRPGPNGMAAIPVVYVSKHATAVPFHERHRIALVVTGSVLVAGAGVAWIILAVGLGWFIGGIVVAAVFVAGLARWSRGGGGRSSGSVTTTTTVRWK